MRKNSYKGPSLHLQLLYSPANHPTHQQSNPSPSLLFKMLPQTLLSAPLTASALSATIPAAPVAVDLADAHSIAEARGIDITGPIPSDATAIPGGYSFEADSDASVWVRAQLASSTSLEKRQQANIGIGMFTAANCGGMGLWVENVRYGTPGTFTTHSL